MSATLRVIKQGRSPTRFYFQDSNKIDFLQNQSLYYQVKQPKQQQSDKLDLAAIKKQNNIKSFKIKQQIERLKEYEKKMLQKIQQANSLVSQNVGNQQKQETESPLDSILDDYRGAHQKIESKIVETIEENRLHKYTPTGFILKNMDRCKTTQNSGQQTQRSIFNLNSQCFVIQKPQIQKKKINSSAVKVEQNEIPLIRPKEIKRPQKIDIWYNRKINLKQFDRTHNEGWQFHKNKYLDLCPLDNYQILTTHQQKPQILNYVNLHDNIPEGTRQLRFTKDNQDKEYDIRKMWQILQTEYDEQFKTATIFNYDRHILEKQRQKDLFQISTENLDSFKDSRNNQNTDIILPGIQMNTRVIQLKEIEKGQMMSENQKGMSQKSLDVQSQFISNQKSDNDSRSVTTVEQFLGHNQSPRFQSRKISQGEIFAKYGSDGLNPLKQSLK